jgi:signal transduction histidine kinase
MEALLSDILDSDPMQPVDSRRQECNVGEVVSRVLAEADLGGDHPLEVDIANVTANINPVHLERIVVNLLNNARQHLPGGVPIWVKVQPQDHGLTIVVEDGGAGVPTEISQTIFEPFRRGPTADTAGLGLGLSLVSRFAELYGGRAWQQERKGGGASFRVFLPSDSPAPSGPPST